MQNGIQQSIKCLELNGGVFPPNTNFNGEYDEDAIHIICIPRCSTRTIQSLEQV